MRHRGDLSPDEDDAAEKKFLNEQIMQSRAMQKRISDAVFWKQKFDYTWSLFAARRLFTPASGDQDPRLKKIHLEGGERETLTVNA